MADFVAILGKTIDGLGDRNTPEMRQKVYERAKKAVADKLSAITPPPTEAQSARQFKLLEDAIATVEASYAPPPVVELATPEIKIAFTDPLADFLASVEADDKKMPNIAVAPKPDLDAFTADATTPNAANTLPSASIDPVLGLDGQEQLSIPSGMLPRRAEKKSGASGLLFGVLGLLVIGGAGYAGYVYKDQIQAYLGTSQTSDAGGKADNVDAAKEADKPADVASETPAVEPAKTDSEAATPKLTQRLNADGTEVDAGPGAKPADIGEGATVAAATTPSADVPAATEPAAGAATPTPATTTETAAQAPDEQTIPVGQKVIFYEEKTGTEQGTADQGAIVWSVVQDSPGLDQPPEPAIRGEINVPDKGIKVRLTIKRNLDKSLPASHIIEMLFTTPPDFAGGPIENVQRFAMKDTEQAPGNPLVGVPASFGDGFFLIALTDEKSAIETNLSLLSKQQWIDIPVAYGSGRRALLSFEKGIPGDKVFQEVIKSWESKALGGG